jgi:hypothetical protein
VTSGTRCRKVEARGTPWTSWNRHRSQPELGDLPSSVFLFLRKV